MKSLIELKGVVAGYGKLVVLENVDLNVGLGEVVSLIGPNGAGKSTVLKSVFGIADISKGKILFRGEDITTLPTFDLVRLGIGYVPQGKQVFPTLTVKENLEMGGFIITDKNLVSSRIDEVMKKFPALKKKKNDLAFTLSGGQQQMLAVARALMLKPQILLLDEPSIGLDPQTTKTIFNKIMEIRDEDTSILIVEQNAKQAINISDRTYVLEDGKVALEGGKNIVENDMIKNIYLGGR